MCPVSRVFGGMVGEWSDADQWVTRLYHQRVLPGRYKNSHECSVTHRKGYGRYLRRHIFNPLQSFHRTHQMVPDIGCCDTSQVTPCTRIAWDTATPLLAGDFLLSAHTSTTGPIIWLTFNQNTLTGHDDHRSALKRIIALPSEPIE